MPIRLQRAAVNQVQGNSHWAEPSVDQKPIVARQECAEQECAGGGSFAHVREVARGYECGLSFANFNDLREGDVVECFEVEMVPG